MEKDKTQITLEDANTMLEVIRVASARGALRAEELTVVGTLFEKLQNYIKENQ